MIDFDNTYARLPDRFYASVVPAQVPDATLVRLNDSLAAELGLNAEWLSSAEGLAMLSGNRAPKGTEPIAQAYAGHQFGGWVPMLGDGRAILLGEVIDTKGNRRDLQLKGSGRTPFSRGGDGKATLGSVIREYLVSEAMAALKVPTTRALAVVASGEIVPREQAHPGGILTRVAASHIRVGTFQFFQGQQDEEAIRLLADHAIARHYPEVAESDNPYLAFFEQVVLAQARLIAHWMQLGFIHGVMNTDNMTVSGETIDFGPCAFIDTFHPQKVFSSIDRNGRYSWSNQPNVGYWNLQRLGDALAPLIASDAATGKGLLESVLEKFPSTFTDCFDAGFGAKLGLSGTAAGPALSLVSGAFDLLANEKVDFTLFFRELTRVAAGADSDRLEEICGSGDAFKAWFGEWESAVGDEHRPDAARLMEASNPVIIPRNHRVEQAIQEAESGDFAFFNRLADALRDPFSEGETNRDLEEPPKPHEVVCETFCGT